MNVPSTSNVVDFFKEFNDRHGHRTGDFVLRAVASAVSGAIRTSDEAFRVGGDEFTIIAPEADASGVLAIARRVEEAVLRASHGPLAITVSIGGAAVPASGIESAGALVGAADSALYDAKGAGRGRIAVALGPAPSEAPEKATARIVNERS